MYKENEELKNNKDIELAICQMRTINDCLSGGGTDIVSILLEYGLNDIKYFKIAESEELDWVSQKIKEILNKRQINNYIHELVTRLDNMSKESTRVDIPFKKEREKIRNENRKRIKDIT